MKMTCTLKVDDDWNFAGRAKRIPECHTEKNLIIITTISLEPITFMSEHKAKQIVCVYSQTTNTETIRRGMSIQLAILHTVYTHCIFAP